MKHSHPLVIRFYEEMQEECADLTLEQVKEVCYGPWQYLKSQMENGELLTVRFKYFGTFTVYKGRAEALLKKLEKRFKEHGIEPDEYFRIKKMIETYLQKLEK